MRKSNAATSDHDIVLSRLREKAKLKKAHRQMLHLFIISSTLIFFTLAFVWLVHSAPKISIPAVYHWNIPIIIGTSIVIYLAQKRILNHEIEKAFQLVKIALGLGILFGVIQVLGWQELLAANRLIRNILFPFSVIHLAHVIIGIVLLAVVLWRLRDFKIHSKAKGFAWNVSRFWHFLGAAWLAFLLLVFITS